MDSFDSYRSSVPARLPASRPGMSVLRASSGSPEAGSHSPLSFQVVIRGTRRYWWLVAMLWVVITAGLSAVIYLKVRPSYQALSVLRAEPLSTTLYGVNTTNETFDMFLETQRLLITSPNVLSTAAQTAKVTNLKRFQGAQDISQEIKKLISVSIRPNSYLIEVAMTSPEPNECVAIVNAVVDAYLATNEEYANNSTQKQTKNLEEYLLKLNEQINVIEERWKAIAAKGDVGAKVASASRKKSEDAPKSGDEGSGRSVTLEQYLRVNDELLQVELALTEAEAVLSTARSAARETAGPTGPVEDKDRKERIIKQKFSNDPQVQELTHKIVETEQKLKNADRIAARNDPAVNKLKLTLKSLNAQYNDLWRSKSEAYLEEMEVGGSNVPSPEDELRKAQIEVDKLRARKVALEAEAAKLKVENQKVATDVVEIQIQTEQRSSLLLMKEAVQRRLEQLRFESRGDTRVRRISEASPQSTPFSDKRITFLAITPFGVLGTVLGLIVLLEIRSGRVADPELLSSRMKHEVFSIAPLPALKPGEDVNNEKAEQRLARFVQSLDHLRVAICEGMATNGEGRCVMITSATGGEGKTTLSAHLAARCANSGTSTLLIDADMRRASLGRLLDVPVGAGLGDVLGGDIELDDALITVQAGGFHFLSAGTPGRDPSRVLKSSRLSELIARLRQTYDLIIIDTPPVLPVADALILGRWADGAVMAARFDASRLPLVERANRQLALAGIPVLGVVVNGVKGQDAAYGNYAYSYNYYPSRSDEPTSS